MNASTVVVLGVLVAGAVLLVHRSLRDSADRAEQESALSATAFEEEPRQWPTTAHEFSHRAFRIRPLAEFAIRARVLSRKDYAFGREAALAPMDLALGWKRMADPSVLRGLDVRQSGRWYHYSWPDEPPIPAGEIIECSANMHMIPATDAVKRSLERLRRGSMVRLRGYLVEAVDASGWRWTSSLSRSDSGGGSCEIVFVQAAFVE